MLAQGRILELLEDWHSLTTTESEAIAALDWPKLDRCHTEKQRLMNELSRDAEVTSGSIQERVNEIIALERQNERDLAAARTTLEWERSVIDRTTRTVRQLSHAYGNQSGPNWHSYS